MLRLFRPVPFDDPELGTLLRSRGLWRGTLALGGTLLPLAVTGSRNAPDAQALAIARRLNGTWSVNCLAVAQALLDHLAPYREAFAADGVGPPPPAIAQARDVWQHVHLEWVSVTLLDGMLVAEVALSTAWDEEHILDARFEGERLFELNGSIVQE